MLLDDYVKLKLSTQNHLSLTRKEINMAYMYMRLSNTGEVISKIGRCGRERAKFLCPRNLAVSANDQFLLVT